MSKPLSLKGFYEDRFNGDPYALLENFNKEINYTAEEGGVDWPSISKNIISKSKEQPLIELDLDGYSENISVVFHLKIIDGICAPFISFESSLQKVTFDGHKELTGLFEIEKDIQSDNRRRELLKTKQTEREQRRKLYEAEESKQIALKTHEHNAYELAFKRETKASFEKFIYGRQQQTEVDFLAEEDGSFSYLKRKQISDVALACDMKRMKDRSGEFVAISLTDIEGNYRGLQRIYDDKKLYTVSVQDGQYKTAHCVIGDIEHNGKAFVVEGFATGATVFLATQVPVIVAMTANNLKDVVSQYSRVYPDLNIVNAADNDAWKPNSGNKGLMTAIEIHKDLNVRAAYPRWDDMSQEHLDTKPTDWNDLHVLCGLKAVSSMIKSNASRLKSEKKYFDYCLQRLSYVANNRKNATEEALKAVGAGMMISPIVHSAKDVYEMVCQSIINGCPIDSFKINSRIKWLAMGKLNKAKSLRSFTHQELNKAHINHIKLDGVVNEQGHTVLPDSIVDIVKSLNGSVIVRAPMGYGKTERLIKPILHHAHRGAYLAHRVSLIGDASQRLNISNYQDMLAYEVPYTDHIACCVNSIVHPKFQNSNGLSWFETIDTLCIDEASQVIRHTVGGPVENPVKVMDGLVSAMRSSNRVVLCDADANDSLIHLCELARPGEQIHIIEVDGDCKNIEVFHTDPDTAFYRAVDMATKHSQKLLIANDSAKDGQKLALQLEHLGHDLRVLHVHKDSKSNAGVEAFLDNPNAECVNYDVIIYSPAISSGVSITTPHFDAHISIFHAVVAPSDAVQMMRRDRTATKYIVGIGINNTQRETDREAIFRGLISADKFASAEYVETEDEIKLRRRKTVFDEMYLECQALENAARNEFANNLILMMIGDGYDVKRLFSDDGEKDDGKVMKKEAGKAVNEMHINLVLNEETPNEERYQKISRSEMRSVEEAAQIDRYHMENQLCVDVIDENLIKFYDDQGIKKVQRLELLKSTEEKATAYDHMQFKNKVIVTRHAYKKPTRAALVGVFDKLGISIETGEGEFTSQDCRDLMRTMLGSRENIELFNALKIGAYVNPRALPKDATTFTKNILAKLGLDVVKRKSAGKSVLSVCPADWEYVSQFIENRLKNGTHSLSIDLTLSNESKMIEKTPEASNSLGYEGGTLAQGGVYIDVNYPQEYIGNLQNVDSVIKQALLGTSVSSEMARSWLGNADFEDIKQGILTKEQLKQYFNLRNRQVAS